MMNPTVFLTFDRLGSFTLSENNLK